MELFELLTCVLKFRALDGQDTMAHTSGPKDRIALFGSFEADIQGGRLTKGGIRVRLQEQPFQILIMLLERHGQLVTREELCQRLWPEGTFVEFDDALNTAIRKLRTALGDSADNPRFLETVPRRGYRFIAPVTLPAEPPSIEEQSPDKIAGFDGVADEKSALPVITAQTSQKRMAWYISAALLIACSMGVIWY